MIDFVLHEGYINVKLAFGARWKGVAILIDKQSLIKMIDHTILRPESTYEQVRATIEYGRDMGTASVCVNPFYVPVAAGILAGCPTRVCTVIGFPFGAAASAIKAQEAARAVKEGAAEVDMVMNIGALKSGDTDTVLSDMKAVVQAAGVPVKVIFDVAYLTDEEVVTACHLCAESGAAFAKTSTGFSPADTKVETVKLMRSALPEHVKIKASGGVNTLPRVLEMLDAGAVRIGTAVTPQILAGFDEQS